MLDTIREGVAAFIKQRQNDVNQLWNADLETQVNVIPVGEPDEYGQYQVDGETFGNLRWPMVDGKDPSRKTLRFNPAKRIARSGSTWWNHKTQESYGVGLDVDATGKASHVNQHDQAGLDLIVSELSTLPYVSICPSTSGRGYHAYVFFDERPKTADHTEHQQVGEQVVAKIANDLGRPYAEVRAWFDKVGQVLWFWGNDSAPDAFKFTHRATRNLNASELPPLPPKPKVEPQKAEPVGDEQLDFALSELLKIKIKKVENDASIRTMACCHRLLDCGITDLDQAYHVFQQYADERPFPQPRHVDGIPSKDNWFKQRYEDATKSHGQTGGLWAMHVLRSDKQKNINDLYRSCRRSGSSDTHHYRKYGNKWGETNKGDVKDWLTGNVGLSDRGAKQKMQPDDPLMLTNIVFGEEYPEPNVWNRTALQYAVTPVPGPHPHFDKILNHLGRSLDVGVLACEWCEKMGITNGYEYLFTWDALVFQRPYQLLPGLGWYSEQNDSAGKSMLVRSLGLLMTGGICRTLEPILGHFNEQLEDCLIWDFDDLNLRKQGQRIKQYMTTHELDVNAKGKKPYQIQHCLHFVQTTNDYLHFPILPQDSRWTIATVEPLLDHEIIPEPILMDHLRQEAPAFLHSLLNHKIPEPVGRLHLPVLETPLKTKLMGISATTDSEDAQKVVQTLIDLARRNYFDDWVSCKDVASKVGLASKSFGQYWRSGVEDQLKLAGFDTAYKPKGGGGRPPMYRVVDPHYV